MVTFICYICDALTFLIMYKQFSVAGDEHSEILLLISSIVFITIDIYYVIWLANIKNNLPVKMAGVISEAVLGYTRTMRRELISNLNKDRRDVAQEEIDNLDKAHQDKQKQLARDKEEAQNKKKSQGA